MIKSCVCYVIDDNYLFPTFVSATQALANVTPQMTDVIIICISQSSERTRLAADMADDLGLKFIRVAPSVIKDLHPMYGRLFIADIIPDNYERVVYIDGDTQIAGSLVPLIEAEIAPSKFLAVRDPSNMYARLSPKWLERMQADRDRAGLTQGYDNYFNSGVLVFNRTDWVDLSRQTLDLIAQQTEAFKFGDQDPMNRAVGDRCVFISNKWNFPGFLIGSDLEHVTGPVIYHFMSNPRPWTHGGLPWGAKWQAPYDAFQQAHPAFAALRPKASVRDTLKYHAQQIVKCATEYRQVGKARETVADIIL